MKIIKSLNNPQIKNIVKLHKTREQRKQSLILIEGEKEISLAILNKNIFKNSIFYYCSGFDRQNKLKKIKYPKEQMVLLNKKVFQKISYRENPDGFFLVAERPNLKLEEIKLSKKALILVAESPEKPGNIGAMARLVDACGADALIITEAQSDIYNPNAIRASRGAIFNIQMCQTNNEYLLEWLNNNKIKIIATTPLAHKLYTECDYKKSSAILIGSEHNGLSEFWLKNAYQKIKIPMRGKIDSLNVSVSAGIILYNFGH